MYRIRNAVVQTILVLVGNCVNVEIELDWTSIQSKELNFLMRFRTMLLGLWVDWVHDMGTEMCYDNFSHTRYNGGRFS